MENLKRITVITVVYNAVNEIEKTIQSVISQDYPSIEYIIIDGASKDGTVDVIKKYENNISSWISEPDNGIYYAMNKGIDMATGEWVIFMNAGDYFYSPHIISDIFSTDNTDYEEYDVIYGDTEFRLKTFSYIMEAMESAPDRFMPFSHQAAFTRTYIAKKNKFDITYRIAADTAFFLKITKEGSAFKHISITVCSYDAQRGMSALNEGKRAKEIVDMQLQSGSVMTSYYKKFIRDAYIKQYMRKLIPEFLWMKIREKKIRKQFKYRIKEISVHK